MPFVYCSATTRQLLLQMEKYPHRINHAKGILEHRKLTYRHLKSILRPLPLQARTEIELGPKSRMQVTLFDANHCPGAVMFLFEGDGKAVVYTGDIRAEPWWVNSIVQNPIFLPYMTGLKSLDCLYLDTTFATHDEPYKTFPTKAEGLMELIQKVKQCPTDTLFYFRSWTLGYENVWITLSDNLNSRVHVDKYQLKLLGSGTHEQLGFLEGPALTGFALGNMWHQGCLTTKNDTKVKIHSCEPGTPCHSNIKKQKNVVWISPIISRLKDGTELKELGAGGGFGDLYQSWGLTFDDLTALQEFGNFCQGVLNDDVNAELQKKIQEARKLRGYNLVLDGLGDILSVDEDKNIALQDLKEALAKASHLLGSVQKPTSATATASRENKTPSTIFFPYSRHSSYGELCHLVGKFRPKDICPCTVETVGWTQEMSMKSLFGDLCSEKIFFYDEQVREQVQDAPELQGGGKKRKRAQPDSQETASQESEVERSDIVSSNLKVGQKTVFNGTHQGDNIILIESETESEGEEHSIDVSVFDGIAEEDSVETSKSKEGNAARRKSRMEAYQAAKRCLDENDSNEWNWYPLRTAGRKGHDEEEEL
ncbi:hypothetical protein LTR84_011518 [Exophiala bonariae]|uniref:Protein artemis n=1 Tax=Exophiala bonariae TaxID=1690606 RepID=A0AAV9NJW6_9EURO|nr:hypothetical protein LTR84_011518 [Exophiala bonariae]